MGVNQVSKALISEKGKMADYFLDMGRVERFETAEQFFTHGFDKLDLHPDRDQDDEEPLPKAIKQEPLRSSVSSAIPNTGPTTSEEQGIKQEHTTVSVDTDRGQGTNESTADDVEDRSAKEKGNEPVNWTARDALQEALNNRDVILALSQRWANTVGEHYSRDVHQLLGVLWSAREPRNIAAACTKLVDLLQLYRDSVEEIVQHERNNIEIVTATGVTADAFAAHPDALKQYEALLVDISGDVEVMASLIEASGCLASD
ncbi:hypothetical protein LTR85_011701 [Meristemomyces frigidus]|nr:hypothetical protein LTR85_011701 [Meristemomyces frigidus]